MTQTSGPRKPTVSRSSRGPRNIVINHSAYTEIEKALERIAAASDEELTGCLRAMDSSDRKKIAQQVEKFLPEAERFADELAKRPDQDAAIRNAAARLRHLGTKLPPGKLILAVTWLFAASGMIAALAAPETMPEINSQVATLGLGIAVTIAVNSKRKHD